MQSNYLEHDVSAGTRSNVLYRRRGVPVGVMVHTTAGAHSLAWLQGQSCDSGHCASIDCLIDRDGTRHIIAPRGYGTYHAGIGSYTLPGIRSDTGPVLHDDDVSNALVGVELECLDSQVPTYEQVDSLAQFIVASGKLHGWRWPYHLVGHYATARPLGRRSDPVNFDWGNLMGRVYVRALEARIPGLV